MKIKNQFRIPLPPAKAWEILNDVPRVAGCAPGAELLEQKDADTYVGTVAVRLGPVSLSFRGTVKYKERNEAEYLVKAEATGNEQRARGTARANVAFQLKADGSGTLVDVDTDVQLAGSIAQYGRGTALIESTAQVLMDEFAKNLAAELGENPAAAGSTGQAPSAEGAVTPAPGEPAPGGATATAAPQTTTAEAALHGGSPAPGSASPRRAPAKEISGFTLILHGLRHAIRRWLGNLTGRR